MGHRSFERCYSAGADIKCKRMDDDESKLLRRVYKQKEGIFPPYGQAATIEQASAFRTSARKLNQISVDFAILVPNGSRALARRRSHSRQRDTHGNWCYVEVYGPLLCRMA